MILPFFFQTSFVCHSIILHFFFTFKFLVCVFYVIHSGKFHMLKKEVSEGTVVLMLRSAAAEMKSVEGRLF